MADHDAIVVGSGVNGLACAALLAKGGWNVCVLERNDWFGGAIKTAEITEPGFVHDRCSAIQCIGCYYRAYVKPRRSPMHKVEPWSWVSRKRRTLFRSAGSSRDP